MAIRDRYTYEVVRRADVTEEDFLAGLDEIGFEIVRNYEALPRNYRVHHKDQETSMDRDLCISKLEQFDLSEGKGEWGEEIVVSGSRDAEFKPVGPIDVRIRSGDEPSLSSGFVPKASERYGVHWGVPNMVSDDLTSPPWASLKEAIDNAPHAVSHDLTGNGVIYYILDTGVDREHPEFDELEYGTRASWVSGGDGFYETNDDDQNHGTGMSTCGAGKSMGVAIHSEVRSAKGLDGNNSGATSALVDGMNALVADLTADTSGRPGVMNNSWSTSSSTAFTTATDAAVDAGMVMIASAGNGYDDALDYPAGYDDVLAIGAMDITRRKADFSNFGNWIDVWSAGVDVLQGWRGGTMGWGNGTSPAGGFMTGLVCCLLQGYKRPTGRADVLAVYTHVTSLAQAVLSGQNIQGNLSATTKLVGRLPTGDQTTVARIPGLLNLVSQKRSHIGGACFSRGQVRIGGVSPARTAPAHPRRTDRKERLHIGLPTPVQAAGDYDDIFPWLCRNMDYVNTNAATDLPQVNFHGSGTDGDGDSLAIPGRSGTDYSFIGGQNTVGAQYQAIPLDMAEDSNPVHFYEMFTNLGWDTGDLTGWTTSGAGTPQVKNANGTFRPYAGLYFFEGTGGADSAITQTADLPASVSTAKIDAGKMKVWFEANVGSSFIGSPNDDARVRLVAVDGANADISTIYDSGVLQGAETGANRWNVHTPGGSFYLPSGTRKLKIIVDAVWGAGTIVNCPVDALMGWVYEETSAGQRALDAVRRGRAIVEHRWVCRSFNIDTDDQGESWFQFRTASNQTAEIDLVQQGKRSPHNWTQQVHRSVVPHDAAIVRLWMRTDRRAGTFLNYYHRDHTIDVLIGDRARRAAGKTRAQFRGSGLQVSTTGFDIAAGSIYRP